MPCNPRDHRVSGGASERSILTTLPSFRVHRSVAPPVCTHALPLLWQCGRNVAWTRILTETSGAT
jgi:hypothetical protein